MASRSGVRGIVASVLFPCPAPSYTIDSFPGELVWIPSARAQTPDGGGGGGAGTGEPDAPGEPRDTGGEAVPCLLLPFESAKFLVVFFHSNAEDLGRCRWFCHFLRDQFQVHVLAVEYPGYGVCSGPPSREGVIANARAALDFAVQALHLPLDQIKVFGRSIGTGPALYLAARYRVAGVVLVTPFQSIRALFSDRVGPLSAIVDEWFENDKEVLKVRSPTMFVHGRKDTIIPYSHGEALYKACVARKLLINPAVMEHNTNLTADVSYLIVPMFRFFALPDYSFQELKVPAWAFDKRRSPLYVRPDVEVCVSKVVPVTQTSGLATAVPQGDDEEFPWDQESVTGIKEPRGRIRSVAGDSPVVDFEKVAVLTQPTVRHLFRATKQRYSFAASVFDSVTVKPGEGAEQLRAATRSWPLGTHSSASQPCGSLPPTVTATSSPTPALALAQPQGEWEVIPSPEDFVLPPREGLTSPRAPGPPHGPGDGGGDRSHTVVCGSRGCPEGGCFEPLGRILGKGGGRADRGAGAGEIQRGHLVEVVKQQPSVTEGPRELFWNCGPDLQNREPSRKAAPMSSDLAWAVVHAGGVAKGGSPHSSPELLCAL